MGKRKGVDTCVHGLVQNVAESISVNVLIWTV